MPGTPAHFGRRKRWARHLPGCFRPKHLNRQMPGPDDGRSDHGHILFRVSGPWLARTLTVPRIAFRAFGSDHEADSELSIASSLYFSCSSPGKLSECMRDSARLLPDPFAEFVVLQVNHGHRSTNKNGRRENPDTRRRSPSGYIDSRWDSRLLGFASAQSLIFRRLLDRIQHKYAQMQSKGGQREQR